MSNAFISFGRHFVVDDAILFDGFQFYEVYFLPNHISNSTVDLFDYPSDTAL